jgi:hypothetical protein
MPAKHALVGSDRESAMKDSVAFLPSPKSLLLAAGYPSLI